MKYFIAFCLWAESRFKIMKFYSFYRLMHFFLISCLSGRKKLAPICSKNKLNVAITNAKEEQLDQVLQFNLFVITKN